MPSPRFKRAPALFWAGFAAAALTFLAWALPQRVTPILAYHHINYSNVHVNLPKANTVTPENFERHMAYLKKHRYHVISLHELVESIKNKRPIPKKSVVITFDDGYDDNYTYAYPVLKEYGFPATIFVLPDLVDQEGYLTLDQMKEMIQNGIEIGSHTSTHAYLPDLSGEKLMEEIVHSKQKLEAMLHREAGYFAYPSGGFSGEIKRIVREAGYLAACTTNRGYDRMNRDVYELKRIRPTDKDRRDVSLWAKFSGYYNLFRKAKDPCSACSAKKRE